MVRLAEQRRAGAALKAVERWKDEAAALSELRQLPSRILVNGLGQTLMFLVAKGGVQARIANEIAGFLEGGEGEHGRNGVIKYIERIMAGDAAVYRRDTREALRYAEWLKRYGQALLADKPEKQEEK